MTNIHPTAVIGKDVVIGKNVEIKPYTVLEGKITIGDGCEIGPFAHVTGWVKIGANTMIHSFAAIGEAPQDYSFDGTPGLIEIGSGCRIREGATVHTPVHGDQGEKTIVGDNVFLMANSHVGHNSKVGENSILTNGCLLAGYVTVEENAVLSGNSAVHQFCRVGAFSMTGGLAKVVQDIPPYAMADGNPAQAHGLNAVGLKRKGFNQEQRTRIKDAHKILYSGIGLKEAAEQIEAKYSADENVMRLVRFIRTSKRGLISGHAE